MKYFNNIHTLEELRKEYKRLVKKYHPDKGGNEETIKTINAEYEKAFEALKNADTSNNKKEARYDREVDQAIRDAINRIIHLDNIVIEIVGSWVWVSGSTYPVKKELKEAGYKFSGNRKSWYFHTEEKKCHGASKRTMDELKAYYGCQEVETEKKQKLTA